MTTIGEQLSAKQQAELAARTQAIAPELDFGQLADPEAAVQADPQAEPQTPVEVPITPVEAEVSAEPRRLPWQKTERRVAKSTQGAPKPAPATEQTPPPKKASKRKSTAKAAAAKTAEPKAPRQPAKAAAAKPPKAAKAPKATQNQASTPSPATGAKRASTGTAKSANQKAKERWNTPAPATSKAGRESGKRPIITDAEEILRARQKIYGTGAELPVAAPSRPRRPAAKATSTGAEGNKPNEAKRTKTARTANKLAMGKYVEMDQKIYNTTGAKHVYGVDAQGKRRHLSHDAVLEAYGYDPKDAQYKADLAANLALAEDGAAGSPMGPEPYAPLLAGSPVVQRQGADGRLYNYVPVTLLAVQSRVQYGLGRAWDRLKKFTGVETFVGSDGRTHQESLTVSGQGMIRLENMAKAVREHWKGIPLKERKWITRGAIGAVAVGAALLASKGLSTGGGAHAHQHAQNLYDTSGKGQDLPVGGAHAGNSELIGDLAGGNNGGSGGKEVFQTVKLHKGDTVWGLERKLHPHATEAQIRHYTQQALHADHLSWEQARHLAEGEEVKIV